MNDPTVFAICDVLVVEDNPDDAVMTLRALRRLQPAPTIHVATDGDEAVKYLVRDHQQLPKLVLLDLKLPKVHGLDVLAAAKGDSRSSEIPVVVLTSSDDPGDVSRANTLGAHEYVCKPVQWDEYRNTVCEAAARYLPGTFCN
jgi:two-component system response regulator